jgi:hypothetical protein
VFFYTRLYGLNIRINKMIPGIAARDGDADGYDLEICLGEMPHWFEDASPGKESWYVNPDLELNGEPRLTIWKLASGEYFHARYADGTEFLIHQLGSQIWGTWPSDTLTLEDTATYLLGPIMGFAMLLRGSISLHASAIIVDNRAIALVGAAGTGKSTTAAAFADLGYAILAEDVVSLNDRGTSFLVEPSYPCIRLWPSSVKALYGPDASLPKLTPTWDKCYLDLNQKQYEFGKEPIPLSAIYLFTDRSNQPAAPFIRGLSISQALIALIVNTYTGYLMDRPMRARAFKLFGRVLEHVPVKELIPHTDSANIGKLCDIIIKDFETLEPVESQPSDQGYPLHV